MLKGGCYEYKAPRKLQKESLGTQWHFVTENSETNIFWSYCYRNTGGLIWKPNQILYGHIYILFCCDHTVGAFILPVLLRDSFTSLTNFMQKLFCHTQLIFISATDLGLFYDEMYINIYHILLVSKLRRGKCWLFKIPFLFCFIWKLFALLEWFWMLQRCMFLTLNCLFSE